MIIADLARGFVFMLAATLAIVFAIIISNTLAVKRERKEAEAAKQAVPMKSIPSNRSDVLDENDWFFINVQECRNDFSR